MGLRQATGTFSRRRPAAGSVDGAPFKAQDLVASRYLIKDVVGAGPLGFVFRAHDKEIDVEVALKVINPKLVQTPEERKQFALILRQARKLSHANLVRVYEEGEDQDHPFFTSQYLDGLTLRKIIDLRLQKGQFFTLHEIDPILSQVGAALDGAHKVGPHSNLKPENVLVLPDLLKVTDFGLGLAIPRPPFVQAMKARKADRYFAPEFNEGGEIDKRADVYSLGVILGEMLSGLTPDGSTPEISQKNPDVPPAVEGVYRRAVNANPLARHKTASEFVEELAEVLKKVVPPPMPQKPEAAAGLPAPTRPRTSTGMLQLQPRRDKPVPPPEPAPPPAPPVTNESQLPDATQRVDPEQLSAALSRLDAAGDDTRDAADPLLDSGSYAAPLDEDAATRAAVETTPAPQSGGWATWALVALLVMLGVGLGAGGGYFLLKKHRDEVPQAPTTEVIDSAEIERVAAERLAARLAAEKAEAEARAAQHAAAAAAETIDAGIDKSPQSVRATPIEPKPTVGPAPVVGIEPVVDAGAAVPTEKVAPVAVVPSACAEGMRLIAAGSFRMGTAKDDPMMGFEDKTLSTTSVSAYCIDLFEYPNRRGAMPTVSVGFSDAERMCESQGKRLCREVEWERACKGGGSLKWTYGQTFDANACNTEDEAGEPRSLAASGRFSGCRSSYGVFDLSGNVAEWTQERVVKGGSFATSDYGVRCASRKTSGVSKSSEVGFRCCTDAP